MKKKKNLKGTIIVNLIIKENGKEKHIYIYFKKVNSPLSYTIETKQRFPLGKQELFFCMQIWKNLKNKHKSEAL